MTPDKKPPRPRRRPARTDPAKSRPSPDDPYNIVYFRRHADDDPGQAIPGREFLRRCPPKVRATMVAVLTQVAAAPPHRFAGGGYWEAMHAHMAGYFEVRVDGPGRHHYRLFCLLDTAAQGLGPLLVIITGADKPFRTTPVAPWTVVRRWLFHVNPHHRPDDHHPGRAVSPITGLSRSQRPCATR
jgi:hypothetical protein